MKPFLIWLGVAVTLWAGASFGTHAYLDNNPRRVVVVVDSSYPMTREINEARLVAESLDSGRYTVFAAYSDKGRIHDFANQIQLPRISAYGQADPDKLKAIAARPDVADATEVLFVTNNAAQEIPAGWTVVKVQ